MHEKKKISVQFVRSEDFFYVLKVKEFDFTNFWAFLQDDFELIVHLAGGWRSCFGCISIHIVVALTDWHVVE